MCLLKKSAWLFGENIAYRAHNIPDHNWDMFWKELHRCMKFDTRFITSVQSDGTSAQIGVDLTLRVYDFTPRRFLVCLVESVKVVLWLADWKSNRNQVLCRDGRTNSSRFERTKTSTIWRNIIKSRIVWHFAVANTYMFLLCHICCNRPTWFDIFHRSFTALEMCWERNKWFLQAPSQHHFRHRFSNVQRKVRPQPKWLDLRDRFFLLFCDRVRLSMQRDIKSCCYWCCVLRWYCARSFCLRSSWRYLRTQAMSPPIHVNGDQCFHRFDL